MNQQQTSEATCSFLADTDPLESLGKAIEESRNLPAYEGFFAKKVAVGQAQSRNGQMLSHSEVLDKAEARRKQLP